MNRNAKGTLFLFLAAIVWGCGLVAQKAGMSHLGPFAFTAIRCTLGGVIMLPLISILNKNKEPKTAEASPKYTIFAAACCSIALTSLILLQQFGLPHTTVGKAGFITALYILITPVMGLFLGKKANKSLWIGVIIGLAGMYLLCLYNGFSGFNFGDIMMLFAAIAAAAHIHVIDHFVEKIDPVKLSSYQFIITGLICVIPTILFETVTWDAVVDCAIPILYAGIFSCAVGYTCQVIGQKYTDPSLSSLILSLETVFSLIAGWLIFGEILATNEYIGCALMFVAIIVAQIKTK